MTFETLYKLSQELYAKYHIEPNDMALLNECMYRVCIMEHGQEVADKFFFYPVSEDTINIGSVDEVQEEEIIN